MPLPPLPDFAPGGAYFPVQAQYDEPFIELDGRTGWYAAGEWRYQDRSRARFLHYDNEADPGIVRGGQWAWHTRFDHLGWQLRKGPHVEILLQALNGETRMDGFEGPLVDNRFWSAFVLGTYIHGSHRTSLRCDRFAVLDHDSTPQDPNAEKGWAWTGAYFYEISRSLMRSADRRTVPGAVRFGGELLIVDSRRPARELVGETAYRRELSLQLSAQWRY
ncbi:MAG: hypothetical protein ABI639_12465 [Thermoanaerobaculia bacterium]